MENPEQVRNIALVGAIDSGKTSLADWLLHISGHVDGTEVGQRRLLDTRQDEQDRGISIKAASITAGYNYVGPDDHIKPYVISVTDSPGHYDFFYEVKEAMNLADGCLFVIDVIEGLLYLNENSFREKLEDGVKPILFINKLDRLISELAMEPA